MGARLAAYYTEAEGLAGLDGKIQLAMLTRIPSTRALIEPDSPDNLSKFEGAMIALRRARPHSPGVASLSSPPRMSERPPPRPGAMADGEELFWGVLDSLHDSVVGIFDRDARCLMVWEARSLEWRYPAREAHECVGDTIARLVSTHCAALIRALHDGTPPHREEVACSIHGRPAWLCVSLSAAHGSHGEIMGVYAFVQDVTEHKMREQALEAKEESLRERVRALQELMTQAGEPPSDLRHITEAATRALAVSYTSVWLFDLQQARFRCADSCDGWEHRAGTELPAQEQLFYLDALRGVRALVVEDAQSDFRTRGFVRAHPFSAEIGPALYAPLRQHGELIGVLGFEVGGREHHFGPDQENLASSVARLVGQALLSRDTRPGIFDHARGR